MTIDMGVPIVLQQMGRVQKIAEQEKSKPERQQATARDESLRTGLLAQDQVGRTQKTGKADNEQHDVDKDGHNSSCGGSLQPACKTDDSEPEKTETRPASESAWQGKIVDLNV